MYKQVLVPALAIVSIVVAAPAQTDEIYRWVDGAGQIHYSDVPRDGAEQIDINPAQTFSAPPVRPTSAATDAADAGAIYDALQIVSPGQKETIWNTGGIITVSVSPRPLLKAGHTLRIYYDGKLLNANSPRETSVQLSDVYRGEHQVSAQILDATGQILKQSDPVTFFYKQNSVQNPVQRAAPSPPPATN